MADSGLPCFVDKTLLLLKQRFHPEMTEEQASKFMKDTVYIYYLIFCIRLLMLWISGLQMCMMEFKNFKTILLIKIYNILFFLVFSVLYHEISSIKTMANSISMNRITTEYRKL